jgi:HSP20 family protein
MFDSPRPEVARRRTPERAQKENVHMAEKHTGQSLASPREDQLTRRDRSRLANNPFQLFDRFADEMDRLFGDVGFGRGVLMPRSAFGTRSPWRGSSESTESWAPAIEVFQRNNELVVRADVPGLTKDDIKVDVTDDAITIEGERKRERQEEREGVYRSERSYGRFCRVVPLPDGAMADQAKATFSNGVLEVTLPAPPEQVRRGRRVEISEAKK